MSSSPDIPILSPRMFREAVAMRLDHPGAIAVAGGTDVVPNLRDGLYAPPALVNLQGIRYGSREVTREVDGTVVVGALAPLAFVARAIRGWHPAIFEAVETVATPLHRTTATLGGNIALDTRCPCYNRDPRTRASHDFCLKHGGDTCHVTGSTRACVAARSGDTVAPLLLHGAILEIEQQGGTTRILLSEVLTQHGEFGPHLNLPPGALIRSVIIPPVLPGWRATYEKEAARAALDFPELSIAVGGLWRGASCESVTIIVSALRPKPLRFDFPIGGVLTDERIREITSAVAQATKPLGNIGNVVRFGYQSWRKRMVGVHVRRALERLRSMP